MKFDGFCRKKEYSVKLQKADVKRVYNIKDKPGYVYNFLEDAEISLEGMKYVVIGTRGEMWAIPKLDVATYEIEGQTEDGVFFAKTKPDSMVYEYKLVPVDKTMTVTIGNGSVLQVNSDKSEHGEGDRLVRIKGEEEYWVVNGLVFPDTYEEIEL